MKQRIYLDYNATTPLDPEVRETMIHAMDRLGGNPSSIHREGQRARAAVEQARRDIADMIGASFTEIVFTSGASEANNLAVRTLVHPREDKKPLLTTAVEHPAVLVPAEKLHAQGHPVVFLKVDAQGQLPSLDEIAMVMDREEIAGVSVMLANNEVGTLYDVEGIARLAKARGIAVHCDATQGVGKVPLDVDSLGVDLLSISSHKFYGPKGVGILYVREAFELAPLILGGHQERGRRGGTENVPSIVGAGHAARLVRSRLDHDVKHMRAMRARLWSGIQDVCPDAVLQGDPERCLPNTLNVRFSDVDGETLLMNFDLDGVAVSAGSACSAGSLEPSHVILAMGVPYEEARGSVRLSVGRTTTPEEVDLLVQRLPLILKRSRGGGW